jgi:hypothetical protein
MELTGGTRVTIITAVAVSLTGLVLVGQGILRESLPYATAGSTLTLTALVFGALVLIRMWISDTTNIRNSLAASRREAEQERSRYTAERCRYIALLAGLESEQGRLNRDMAAARQQMARDLIKEREAIRAEFEEKRNELISETMEATILMIRDGKLAPDATPRGRLIRFPHQGQQAPAPQRERSREHGIVGP